MAAKLKRSESGTYSARRVARQRIEAALKSLDGKVASDQSVHSARKELKKARATLRLLRDALGDVTYKRENAALRDVARPLSAVRDSRVLVDALGSLLEHSGAHGTRLPLTKFQHALIRQRAKLRAEVFDKPGALLEARKVLRATRARAGRWQVGRDGWWVLGSGLERTYARGRRAFALARRTRTDQHLHEWRKQTKYFWYQLQLFESCDGAALAAIASRASQLANFLGQDHDLAVLREQAVVARELFPTAASHRALLSLIARRRAGLQRKALLLGRRLYAQKPGELRARIGKYWQKWHHPT